MRQTDDIQNLFQLQAKLLQRESSRPHMTRPFVAVSYAQGIDGSIATKNRQPLNISGRQSLELTHRLRALFGGILVGINTVLADDPQLTVRLVDGENPQPVVLDTRLRTPLECRLLQRTDRNSWLASAANNNGARVAAFKRAGAQVLPCRRDDNGQIDLHHLMAVLFQKGVESLMVEGGAKVITSFIHAELVDLFIITISPKFIGGLQVVEALDGDHFDTLELAGIHYEPMGQDLIVWATPVWTRT